MLRLLNISRALALTGLGLATCFSFDNSFTKRSTYTRVSCSSTVRTYNVAELEKQVLASSQARLDAKQLWMILNNDDEDKDSLVSSKNDLIDQHLPAQWKIALSAGLFGAVVTMVVTHSLVFACLVLAAIFLVANGDPLEEETAAGAVTRVVGRLTLESIQASQPKLKAIAKTVITGEEEVAMLNARIHELESESESLKQLMEQRMKIEESLSSFKLSDLQELARRNGIPVRGSKSQLLTKLVDAKVISL